MFILSKIFGECPQIKLLEVFVDNFDEELSIPDILWLTDIPKTTVYSYINKLLDEKILLKGNKIGKTQFYYLNNAKEEVKIVLSLFNYIVLEKLADKLEEKGLKRLEEHEMDIAYIEKKKPFGRLILSTKNYSSKISDLFTGYKETKKINLPKYDREVCI